MPAEKTGQEEPLPASIIAQAEACIVGNAEDTPPIYQRRPHPPQQIGHQVKDVNSSAASRDNLSSTLEENPGHLRGSIVSKEEENEALPQYSDHLQISQDGFDTQAKLTDDGRVNISINQKTRKLSELLAPALRSQLSLVAEENERPLPPGYLPPALGGQPGQVPPPHLNVVIHVVGSRGDVQPFVALGKVLKTTYGHRVRIATHPTFQSFIEENGLEFFSIGGDPAELMAFMVKNPGLMPGFDSLKSGDVGKRRKGMEEIVLGCWRSCIESGDGLGAPPIGDLFEGDQNSFNGGINMETNPSERPFIADAIIANPPSFAHIHIAEKLGVPLHMMFTMPWSPTQSFPHPLANIQSSNADVNMTNFISYALVEMMTWQGLGDVINRFRERVLGLEPISLIWAPGMLSRLRIPYTYCWSPALIPKPKDWGQQISISGFYFLSLASSFVPDPDLAAFLADGPPPIYIGFGSIVVDDPNSMTRLIFDAVRKSGIRALVSKGWGGLGADAVGIPENVFMLGNVPHDWLFKHVSCVIHHGGAGTSAAGFALGKPTVVVPFFGDQPWWGAMIYRAGAGPAPIPFKQLTVEKLTAAISEALKPETLEKAQALGEKISQEKGTEVGGKSFHDQLNVDSLRCSVAPTRVAVWRVKRTKTRLSALAATVLANEGLLDFADLKLFRGKEYEIEDGPWDPISGGASALLGTIASLTMGVADFPVEIFKAFKARSTSNLCSDQRSTSSGLQSPQPTSRSQIGLESADNDDLFRLPSSSTASTIVSSAVSESGIPSGPGDTPATSTQASTPRGRSLKDALSGRLSRSRSCSRDRKSSSQASSPLLSTTKKPFDPSTLTLESAVGAGKGLSRIVGAGLKSPMDFSLGLARGFHNAPKLYGDQTVRPQEKVTDFQSGLRAAGKEFGYGFYDGISGLITQPMKGAEKDGAAGLIKGIGMGIGGLVLKPGAAIWGLPGYTLMGIHKEVHKLFGPSVQNFVISARTAQGYEQSKNATEEERQIIIKRWIELKSELQSTRQKIHEQGGPDNRESGRLPPKSFLQSRLLSFQERKELHEMRKQKREQDRTKSQSDRSTLQSPSAQSLSSYSHGSIDEPQVRVDGPSAEEFERAIQTSISATSRGNQQEDELIERAIRASVRELQSHGETDMSEQEAIDLAIKASIAEASNGSISDAEHAAYLEKAIQDSLNESPGLQLSQTVEESTNSDDDFDLKHAIEVSQLELEKFSNSITEEEIVLEYVKKQSLLEEQLKRNRQE